MLQLPAKLEQRLKSLFPRAHDRETFVKEVVERAIEQMEKSADAALPTSVGGALHLYTDGGSRGNPGEAAIGCVLIDPHTHSVIEEHKVRIGIGTNNEAEYRALIAGLRMAQRHHPNTLLCHLDSELIVRQLSGQYRVKMPTLQPLFDEVQTLAGSFKDIRFSHVPRSKNAHADRLVNQALDE